MAELAYGIAESVLEKLGSIAYEELSMVWDMKKDLKKLQEKITILQSVLKDAEKKQACNERLRMWLVRVKDVFNDAMDVLDEVDCESLRRQVVKEYGSVRRKVRRFFSSSNPIVFRFSIAHKVKEIRERLDEIAKDMAQFQLISAHLTDQLEDQSRVMDQEMRDRMTHSFVKASEVIGRDLDKAEIIDLLLCRDDNRVGNDNLSVVPIVGIDGLGKTTLAKLAYNDDKVNEWFDLKLWVCVSLDFDVTRLLREILKETEAEEDVSKMSLDQLQTSLRRVLEGKRLLLVLDDVWNEDRSKWIDLREILAIGAEGTRVIVTTRSTLVSSIMTTTPPHLLKGLSEEDSLALFFKCAFGVEKLAGHYPRLKDIGKEIVGKCKGVPLALKTLGSLLYSKAEAEWVRIRDNEIWELEREHGRILPALRVSYDTMSPCLKWCFARCSTFPEDTPMTNIELISKWIALGILQSSNGKMELEDFGQLQIDQLCARSFFENHSDVYKVIDLRHIFSSYTMHDLVHDLARSITQSECAIINSGGEIVSDSVRHLRIFLDQNNLKLVQRLPKLLSIHIDGTSKDTNMKFCLATCIAQLRYLRVFHLQELYFEVLPSSIGTLRHLRYLNLSRNYIIKRLPDSICELQSLQTLLLAQCYELEELPRGIRKLVSLRTLSVTTKQMYFPENGIGRLKSLRTLIIIGCENLRSLPHDMKYCTTLRTLFIVVCKEIDLASEPNEVVTELSLQTLFVMELPKMTALPQWLKGASQTLKVFLISECHNLVVLPEWLVSLQTLLISECKELLALPDGMQHLASLAHLGIGDCERLDLTSRLENVMPLTLQMVSISSLPQTTSLPHWLQGASNTLKLLKIEDCPKLAALPEWLPNFSSLGELEIVGCEELLALPDRIQHLTSLTDLRISDCEQLDLVSECNEVVQLSLQSFCIEKLPQTTSLPKWLHGAAQTLQTLGIEDCPKLAALPKWLPDLTSLKKLVIKSCLELSSLPEGISRLTSVTHLEIISPSTAFYERYRPEVGEDWEAIAHIPNIHIDNPFNEKCESSNPSPEQMEVRSTSLS